MRMRNEHSSNSAWQQLPDTCQLDCLPIHNVKVKAELPYCVPVSNHTGHVQKKHIQLRMRNSYLTRVSWTARQDERDEDSLPILSAHNVEAQAGLALHQHHCSRLSEINTI
jgi:hypothetical protein